MTREEARQLRKRAYRYFLRNGKIWRVPKRRNNASLRIIARADDQEKLISEFHESPWSGYRGTWATFEKLKEKYCHLRRSMPQNLVSVRRRGLSKSLMHRWIGPFTVVRAIKSTTYLLRRDSNGRSPPLISPASSPMIPQAHLLAHVLSPCPKTPCFSQGGNVVSLECECMPSCCVCMCSFVHPFSTPFLACMYLS